MVPSSGAQASRSLMHCRRIAKRRNLSSPQSIDPMIRCRLDIGLHITVNARRVNWPLKTFESIEMVLVLWQLWCLASQIGDCGSTTHSILSTPFPQPAKPPLLFQKPCNHLTFRNCSTVLSQVQDPSNPYNSATQPRHT